MGETTKTASGISMHAKLLAILGIFVLIIGAAIITIPHMPLRGSGAGTLIAIFGVILLIIAFLRMAAKK